MTMRRVFSFSKKHPTTNPWPVLGPICKLNPEMALLPQIPQIWEGSGALKHGSGFLRKPDPIFGNGGPFLGSKWGTPGCPRVLLTPTTTISRTFYSLTSIFTSETSERERTCKYKHTHLLMLHMMSTRFLLSSTK